MQYIQLFRRLWLKTTSIFANWTHKSKLPLYRNAPQEVWDTISAYLPPSSTLSAASVFDFEPSPYDRVWTAVFKNEDWLESHSAKDANIVLIGADLDILSGMSMEHKARPRLVLAAFDRHGDLQYLDDLLRSSLRGGSFGLEEYQLEQLTLAVSRLDVPEVLGNDFRYLFSYGEQKMQTKYCYWKDPERKIRTLRSQNIRGIDGPIVHTQDLRPIFLLNLNPPTQNLPGSSESLSLTRGVNSDPLQFIFRCFGGPSFWTGCPPLVSAMLSEGWEQSRCERTFEGFTFNKEGYKKYHRQDTNWISIAECESGRECAVIC